MRRRVLAGQERTTDEQTTDDDQIEQTKPSEAVGIVQRRRRASMATQAHTRFLIAGAASLFLLAALSGMSGVLSQNAVPGDPLYAFKRSVETAQMGLTFGAHDRGLQHVDFARTRAREITTMAVQSAGRKADNGQLDATLDDFDTNVRSATRLLSSAAVKGDEATDALTTLRTWAVQQQQRLSAVRDTAPPMVTSRLDRTLELLAEVQQRAAALAARSDCLVLTTGVRDELGPLPAQRPCSPAPSASSRPNPLQKGPNVLEQDRLGARPGSEGSNAASQQPSRQAANPENMDRGERLRNREPVRDLTDDVLTPHPKSSQTPTPPEPSPPSDSMTDGDKRIPLPGPDLSVPQRFEGEPETEAG